MMRRRWLLDAGIANAVDDLPQRLGLYISDIHNKYTFELLSTNSAAIGYIMNQRGIILYYMGRYTFNSNLSVHFGYIELESFPPKHVCYVVIFKV